jgi:hypothetical protein
MLSEFNQAVQKRDVAQESGIQGNVMDAVAGRDSYYADSSLLPISTFSLIGLVFVACIFLLSMYMLYAIVRSILLGKAEGWRSAHGGFVSDISAVVNGGKRGVGAVGRAIAFVVQALWRRVWLRTAIIVVILFALLNSGGRFVDIVHVKPGQALVNIRTGYVGGMGYHLVFPFVSPTVLAHVANYDFDIQNITADSTEPQDVNLQVNVVFHLQEDKLQEFYTREGVIPIWEVANSIVTPRAIEAVKKVVNHYSFKEVLLSQTKIKDEVTKEIEAKLDPLGITLTDLNIVNIMIPRAYVQKIQERELVSESTEIAKRRLEEEKTNTQTELEIAERNRQKNTIEAAGFKTAAGVMEQMLEQKRLEIEEAKLKNVQAAIDKWNGQLPTNVGDGFSLLPTK